MAYKIKRKNAPKPEYFKQKEIDYLREKYKGKFPPLSVTARTGTRQVSGIYKRIYKKGKMVEYKKNLAQVERVTPRGIHIKTFKKGKDGFPTPTGKVIFVSAREVEKGKVYPFFTRFPMMWGYTPFTI